MLKINRFGFSVLLLSVVGALVLTCCGADPTPDPGDAGVIDCGVEHDGGVDAPADGPVCSDDPPQALELPCSVDEDCPTEGPCYVFRCLAGVDGVRLCQPNNFQELAACFTCSGERRLCDADGACTIPEP